jgi:hypothetical protein
MVGCQQIDEEWAHYLLSLPEYVGLIDKAPLTRAAVQLNVAPGLLPETFKDSSVRRHDKGRLWAEHFPLRKDVVMSAALFC